MKAPRAIELDAFLTKGFRKLWKRYLKRLKRCQKKFSEKSVHNLRVETRRLLSTLDLLRVFLDSRALRRARSAFKERLNLFGKLRDTQVHLLYVHPTLSAYPEARSLLAALEQQETRFVKQAGKRVRKLRLGKLARVMDTIDAGLRRSLREPGAHTRHAAALRHAVDQAFRKTSALRTQIDPDHSETIHRTRVAFKKFRYMVECLQPLLPGIPDPQIDRMHDYQTRMGEIQDMETLLACVDKLVNNGRVPLTDVTGLRAETERRRRALIERYLASADELLTFWPPPAAS